MEQSHCHRGTRVVGPTRSRSDVVMVPICGDLWSTRQRTIVDIATNTYVVGGMYRAKIHPTQTQRPCWEGVDSSESNNHSTSLSWRDGPYQTHGQSLPLSARSGLILISLVVPSRRITHFEREKKLCRSRGGLLRRPSAVVEREKVSRTRTVVSVAKRLRTSCLDQVEKNSF